MLLIAPKLGEPNLANGKTIRTILPKLKNQRKHHAEIIGGSLKLVRVTKRGTGYVIEYRNKNPKWYYQTTSPLNQRTAEKALTKYTQGKPYWKKEIEFKRKKSISYSLGYIIGRILRPFGEFSRGVKLGYNEVKYGDNKSAHTMPANAPSSDVDPTNSTKN